MCFVFHYVILPARTRPNFRNVLPSFAEDTRTNSSIGSAPVDKVAFLCICRPMMLHIFATIYECLGRAGHEQMPGLATPPSSEGYPVTLGL